MGIGTTFLGTMKFFRRKDKRKNDSDSGGGGYGGSHSSRMPGFGSSSNNNNGNNGYGINNGGGKHSAPAHGGGYMSPGSRPDHRRRPFGSSPPSGGRSFFDHGDDSSYGHGQSSWSSSRFQPGPSRVSAALLARFPEAVFARIFAFVCPHARDESYATCEQSAVEDGCMLCDLRDLARCVAVCRRWRTEAVKLLYVAVASRSFVFAPRRG
jgi:hypothetical protein